MDVVAESEEAVVAVEPGEVQSSLSLVEKAEPVVRVNHRADTRPHGLKERKRAMGPEEGS